MNTQTTNPTQNKHNLRIKAYRNRLAHSGVKRIEVRIPASDAPLVHSIADILRTGGDEARNLRSQISHSTGEDKNTTGKDLINFFRTSILMDTDLDLERDSTTSRTLSLQMYRRDFKKPRSSPGYLNSF